MVAGKAQQTTSPASIAANGVSVVMSCGNAARSITYVLKQFSDAKDRGDIVLNWEAGRHPTRGPSRVAAISETWSRGATANKDAHYCFASSYDAAARRAGGSYPPGPKIAFTGGLESTITA